MLKSLILSILISTLFSACQNRALPKPIQMPKWINQPYANGHIGAVGSAKPHFKGVSAQRKLAIARALDELSQQSGVKIQSEILTKQSRKGIRSNSSIESYSVQNSSGKVVKAHIEQVWTNPKTKEIYIWLLAD